MKLFLFILMASTISVGRAQSDKYVAAMEKNLALFDSAKTTQDYQTVANNFERIAEAEKTQWLPYYYAGLALVTSGWSDPKIDKDANAARINSFCDKAASFGENSEIYCLRNMAATQQMMVNPQIRWATYGQQAHQALEKGMALDPNNPRLYYLQGESVYNTPAAFGGGKDKAKPIFEKAIELFKKEQPKPLYPRWGLERSEEMLAHCNK
ncbi:MAG: hypothetical protein C5B59_00635 [Bacteroidetes bacterium]|nr:MAG: hypothetical protein C5B59_00635 [Bacteroidota bacterium]